MERLGGELFLKGPVSLGRDRAVAVATFFWGCFFISRRLLAQGLPRRGFLSSSPLCAHSPETEPGAALRRATDAHSGFRLRVQVGAASVTSQFLPPPALGAGVCPAQVVNEIQLFAALDLPFTPLRARTQR